MLAGCHSIGTNHCQEWAVGGWGMGKVDEGEWEVQMSSCGMNSHGKKRHNIKNTVNALVRASHGDRW